MQITTRSTSLRTVSAPISKPKRRPGGSSHLVIATDASIVPGHPGAGIAAVSSDGTTWNDCLPGTCDITWAELNAIRAAVINSAGHPHVVILSDNQGAVAIAAGKVIPIQKRMRRLATEILALRSGRDVSISWVRAHRGHKLNEAADALARKARRLGSVPTAA